MTDRIEIGKNLKKKRIEKQYSIKGVAKLIGCSEQTLMSYERGSRMPKIERMKKMAEIYETNINDLFAIED